MPFINLPTIEARIRCFVFARSQADTKLKRLCVAVDFENGVDGRGAVDSRGAVDAWSVGELNGQPWEVRLNRTGTFGSTKERSEFEVFAL